MWMATVIFYEKPGCVNNSRQKKLLEKSGHKVVAFNLLKEAWTTEKLKLFLQCLPKAEWFNHSAPELKAGEINPDRLNAAQALQCMISNPLLIRRPLMQVHDQYMAGFDLKAVNNWIGLQVVDTEQDLQTCRRVHD